MSKTLRHLAAATLLVAACAKPGNLPVASVEATVPGGAAPFELTVATGSTVHLDAGKSQDSAGKVDGAISYEWSLVQAPRGSRAKIESPSNKVSRFTPDVPSRAGGENYLIQLVVKTDVYASAPATLTIIALDCGVNAPVTGTLVANPSSSSVQGAVSLSAPAADDKDNSPQCQAQLHGLQPLRYAWSLADLPAGSHARPSDPAAVAPSFVPDVPGTYTAQLVVTDSTGRSSAPGQIAINVAPCGGAVPLIDPVAFTSSPVSPNLGQPTQLLPTVTDADSGAGCGITHRYAYQWSVVSLPKGSAIALNSRTVVAPSFTPDVEGTYRFRLVVTNERGTTSAPVDHVVTAKACGNAPPVPTIAFQPSSVGIGTPVQFDVNVDDADASCGIAETYNYRWSLVTVPVGSMAQLNNTSASRPSFTPDQGGDYVVGLQVTDSSGTTASASAHVTVKTCGNSAPIIDSLQGIPATPLVGLPVTLAQTVSDANSACPGYDATQTFRWSLVARPDGSAAAIIDPTAASTRFTPDSPGSYQIQLVVTNAAGIQSAPRIVTITTSTCGSSRPTITAAAANPASPDPGTAVALFASADDVDNSGACGAPTPLSFQWAMVSRPPGSGALLSNPSAANPAFTPDKVGSYQFTVQSIAANGLRSAPTWLTVSTTACGTGSPSVAASPASLALLPRETVTFRTTPSESASCASALPSFHYAWQVTAAPAASSAVLSDPASPAPSFTPDAAGDYLLQVAVTDDKGAVSQPAFVHLTVSGCASLGPSIDYLTATAGGIGLPVALQAHAIVDRNCLAQAAAAYQYRWQMTSRPPSSQSVVADPTAAQTAFTPDVAGAYQVQLVVTDGLGLVSLPVYRTVTIAPCSSSTITWDPATPITASFVEPDGITVTPLAYRGSVVTLGTRLTDQSPACNGTATAPYAYRWALVARPAGSNAQLSSATAAGPAFVPDVPGDYQVAAVVTDALGTVSAPAFTTISTQSCGKNLPQVAVSPSGAQTVNTLSPQAVQVQGLSATDADSDPAACPARFAVAGYTYAWSIVSAPAGGRAQLSSSAGLRTSFEALTPGTYRVQLVATASNGLSSAPATVSFVAGACGSHAPQVVGVTTQSGGAASARPPLGQPVRLTAAASDADITTGCSDSLTYGWRLVSEPAGSLVNGPASASTDAFFDFTPDVAGTYAFTVVATDSTGLSSAPFPVSVLTGACGPTFGALTASNRTPGVGSVVTVGVPAVSDACVANASFSYAWSVATRPTGSTAILATPAAASSAFTPDVPGSYVLQLVVADNGGFTSAPARLTLTAGRCGTLPPTLGAVGSSIASPNIGDAVSFSAPLIDNNSSCAAGLTQPYAWQWSLLSAPAGSHAALSSSSDAAPALVPDAVGAYQLSVTATDALGNVSAPAFFTLVTSRCGANRPTVAIAPQPVGPATQLVTNALAPVALTATAADADNSCPARFQTGFTYAWSIASGPAGATSALSAPTARSSSFAAATPGSYVVQVIATSATGLSSAPATVAIQALSCGGNAPAIVQVTTQAAGAASSRPAVGTPVTLTAAALDPDNAPGGVCSPPLTQAISYAWSLVSTPAGASVSTAGATAAAFTFTPAVAGTYVFSVVATDSTGLSSAPYTVVVPTGSCGPGLTGISATAGAGTTVNLAHLPATIADSCVANGGLSYAWSVLSRPPSSGAGFAVPSAEAQAFAPDVPGSYVLQLVVTDSGGFSTAATTTVTAGGCAAGPSLAANAAVATPAAPFRDDTIHLSIPAAAITSACGNGQLSYEWALISRPAASRAQLDAANVPSPSFTADVAGGVWQAMVIVRDSLGNASAPQFVTVSSSVCGALPPVPAVSVAPTATPFTFATVTLSAATTDPNAGCPGRFQSSAFTYAWSLASQPAGAAAPTLAAAGATAQLTPRAPGAYQIAVVATSSLGASSAPVLATVTAQQCGYNAPSVQGFTASQPGSGLAAPALLDNNLDVTLGASVQDADNTACSVTPAQTATLSWTLTAKPAGSAAQLRFSSAAAPVIRPDLPGTYALQVVATDSTGLTGSANFSFSTSPSCGSAPPVAQAFSALQTLPAGPPISVTSANAATASLDLGYPVQIAATVVDGDAACGLAETVSYAWSLAAPAGSRAVLAGPTTAAPGFVPDVLGTYSLALTLTDSTGLSSTQTFAVRATCGAAPPLAVDGAAPALRATQSMPSIVTTAGPGAPLQITSSTVAPSPVAFFPGTPVQLAANVTDADAACGYPAETIRYAWSFAKLPAGSIASFVNAADAAPVFVPDVAGEYDVQLTLTDSTGRSTTQVFAQVNGKALVGVSSCGAQLPTAQIGIDGPLSLAAPVSATPVVFHGATVLFNGGTSSTPDAQPLDLGTGAGCGLSPSLTYAWSFVSAPAGGGSLSSKDLSNPGFIPGADGLFTVQLVVSEGSHRSFPATATVRAATPAAARSSFTALPATVVADGVATATLTATARDAQGIPIAGAFARFSTPNGKNQTLLQPAAATDASGVITGTVASTLAQSMTLNASFGPVAMPPQAVQFIPGPAAQIVWTTQPGNSIQNKTIVNSPGPPAVVPPVLTIQDAQGNNITATQDGASAGLTVALGPNPPVANAQLKLTQARPRPLPPLITTCPCNISAASGGLTLADSDNEPLSITKLGNGFSLVVTGQYVRSSDGATVTLTQALSLPFNITPPPAPTAAPGGLSAAPGVRSIQLAWSAFSDLNLTGYNLLRTNPDASTTQVGGLITSTSFTDTGLADGAAYGYQVRAVNTGGPGPWSAPPVSATTAPPPPAITSLTPRVSAAGIAWGPATAATSYNLLRATSMTGTYARVASNLDAAATCSGGACQTIDGGLSNGTAYFYKVEAANAGGAQASAAAGPVTPTVAPDAAHSALTLAAASPNPPIADQNSGAILLVTALDSGGRPIANTPVAMQRAPADTGDAFTVTSGYTNGSGQFTTRLQSLTADAKTFTATVGPADAALSLTLVVQYVGGAPKTLAFVAQPGNSAAGQQFGASVAALDQFGNPTGQASTITVALANGAGAALSGTTTLASQSGVSSFLDLSINQPLNGGHLHATSSIAGVTAADSAPFNITAAIPASSFGALATSLHTCGIAGGKLYCWGPNGSGQLGTGGTASSPTPVQVGNAADWTAVSNGNNFSCGLRGAALYCWGDNGFGQLGQGSVGGSAAAPVPVAPATSWTRVATGDFHACATDSANALYCWGNNQSSQLGLVSNAVFAPTLVSSASWTAVSAGAQHSCGVQASGQLFCFGLNSSGQIGTGTAGAPVTAPTALADAGPWASVSAGSEFTCATKTAGSAFCWGRNDNGQLGSLSPANQPSPVRVGALADWTQLSSGFSHACGRHSDNSLTCWGANANGELGDGTLVSRQAQTPAVAGGPWSAVSAGFQYTCGVSAAGAVSCWGNDVSDALGTGTATTKRAPARVDARAFVQVVAGSLHSCALRTDGTAWCSGSNAQGQLGDGSFTDRTGWTGVGGGHLFARLSASANATCGVATSGTLWCWGQNDLGQAGDGTAGTNRSLPVQVGAASDWLQVATGGTHACGTRSNGGQNSVYCWGGNAGGDLADATVAFNSGRSTPGPIIDSGYALAVAGGTHSCGIKAGALFCWGANDVGQLGQTNAVAQSTAPLQLGAQTDWTALAAGAQDACGLRGTQLACWGSNTRGQLGAAGGGTFAVVGVPGSWARVSPGPLSTCAIATNGTLSCFGANDSGQLGLGDQVDRSAPVQVGAATNWASVAVGASHACGLRTDDSLWCWGSGASGQLGDGGPNRTAPVAVIDPALAPRPSGVPSAANSTISLSRTALPADGTSTTSISILVKDAAGTPVANQPVTITADGTGNTLVAASAVTDGAGALVATLASTTAQAKTITAAVGSFNLNAGVVFQARAADQAASSLTLGAASALAGTNVSVTVRALDASGNPSPAQQVTLARSGSAATFAAAAGFTDSSGRYVTTITSASAESDTVTATVGGATLTANISFFGPASQVVFVQQPQAATPGTTIGAVKVAIEDALGNVMVNDNTSTVSVALGNNPGGATLTPAGGLTIPVVNGVASFSPLFVSAVAQGYTLVATSGAFQASSSAFNIAAPWALTRTFTVAVNDVKMDPSVTSAPATGYAATSQGVFRTTDGGATWAPYTTGMSGAVNVLAVDKNGVAWAGTASGVYTRNKGGATWTAASTGLTGAVTALVVGTSSTSRLWAVTSADLFVTSNSGGAWSLASSGLPAGSAAMSALTVDPTNSTVAYVGYGDGHGVWQSSISGSTVSWADQSMPGNPPVTALAIDSAGLNLFAATRTANLYVLVTSGKSAGWSHASTGNLPSPVVSMTALALHGNNVFAGFADGEVFSNTAATAVATGWTAAGTGLSGRSITALAGDPTSSAALFSVQPVSLISRTVNSGGAWASSSNGLAVQINAIAVDPATPANVYAATSRSGVQISTDAGVTFSAGNGGFAGVSQVYGLAIDTQHGLVWAATDAGPYSSPLGATPAWTALPVGGNPQLTGVAADAQGRIYLSAANGLYSGTGASWSAVALPGGASAPVMPLTAVAADPAGGFVLVGASNATYRSLAGAAFQLSAGTAVASASAFVLDAASGRSYAAAPAGVFKSAAGGDNFASVTPAGIASPFTGIAFLPSAPATVYAASNGSGVFRSTDSGTTWTAVNTGLDAATTAIVLDPTSPLRLYAGSASGGFYKTGTGGL